MAPSFANNSGRAGGLRTSRQPLLFRLSRILREEETLMIEGLFQPMHLLVIIGIALLVFGPKKLPELGKGLGDGIRGFKAAMSGDEKPPDRNKPEAPKKGE